MEKAGMLGAAACKGMRGLWKKLLFLISGILNCIFLTVCVGLLAGTGSPSMRHPCRVTAKLPSMAIPPGIGTDCKKNCNLQ